MKKLILVCTLLFLWGCSDENNTYLTDDGTVVTKVYSPANSCTEVAEDLYVENIGNSVFDVYYNDECKDSLGEYCDNVIPSYGSSGIVDSRHHPGSATVCWAEGKRLSGYKIDSDGITIVIEDFSPL